MSFRTKQKISLFILVGILITMTAPALYACPGCAAALGNEVGNGFNLSVLYMMAMPFVVFGGVALGIVYITKQNQSKIKISTVKKEEEN